MLKVARVALVFLVLIIFVFGLVFVILALVLVEAMLPKLVALGSSMPTFRIEWAG